MDRAYEQVWDLDSFFPGGSGSAAYASFLERLEEDIARFGDELRGLAKEDAAEWSAITEQLQSIWQRLVEAESFAACVGAENQEDKRAALLAGKVKSLRANFASALTVFDERLSKLAEEEWNALLRLPAVQPIEFALTERREQAKDKLPPEQEALIQDLAVDGYHAWGELYNRAVSGVRIPFEDNGKTVYLSAGQAHNKLHSPDREARSRLFAAWEEAWGKAADVCADALNHLAGFRLQTYRHRGWDSALKEPLLINRMTEQTLNAMWEAVDRNKAVFLQYLERKAERLGADTLAWHDVEAPLGSAEQHYTFEEGARFIVRQFRMFSPRMADFAEMAFERRWIEAEDRPGKRPGGFCTAFPVSGQTRIFMTYAGTASNVATLAHELGHAYHQHVMNDLPALAQEYPMNVAETASTFAESIVSDAAVRQAASKEEKIALLEDKVQRSVAFFMNIRARFLFETRFYELRRKGLVSVEQLNALMVEAQKEAFGGALSGYHPHFWASKLHFYLTDVPFYNFPYTFGYLFSAGIYAHAKHRGAAFEEEYIDLLRDTGSMTVEDLAMKHLDVDLRKPDFWQSAVGLAADEAAQLLKLLEQ